MTETRFKPLRLEDLRGEQRRVAEAIMTRRNSLDGPFSGMLRSPKLADLLQQAGAYLRFDSVLPARLRELAILLTARKWNAQYEWYAHRRMAEEAGLAPKICDQIAHGQEPSDLAQDERVVYVFASSLLTSGGVDDATFAAVVDRFGEQAAAELIATAGYYTIVSFFLNVDRFPLPAGAVPLPPLTEPRA